MSEGTHFTADVRERAALAVVGGMMVSEVSSAYGVDRKTVSRWVAKFLDGGRGALNRKLGSGRPRKLEELATASIDNESRELILVGDVFAIAGEAGQIFRATPNSDWGIDGEIEFKDENSEATGQRLYLQLKSGDSYLYHRKRDDNDIFPIKKPRWAKYWQSQAYPVMLVIRTSDGEIRWMDVSAYLKEHGPETKQIVFDGELFTAESVLRMRDELA